MIGFFSAPGVVGFSGLGDVGTSTLAVASHRANKKKLI
jgi:hypothetical protein